jgi:hypothetical protein
VYKVGGLYYDFYVEPETGILREVANFRKWRSIAREKEPAKPLEVMPIAELKEYRKIGGIWYYREWTEVEVKEPVYLRGVVYRWSIEKKVVSEFKRQLGKKQLKELGLING